MIARLLIANRGEIARRIIRTCTDLGIESVAVCSDADVDAAYVREATTSVRLAGSAPADTYLRSGDLIDAARMAGADAIHPGYGFLSENAAFARAVSAAGLTWVGPDPDSIEAMGSKVEAKKLMEAAGVPVLPDPTRPDPTRPPSPRSDSLIQAALDQTVGSRADRGEEVGSGWLVKASAGGGGRGMRIVRDRGGLEAAVQSAQAEAASAFGDSTVFVEPYLESARHIEVQVLADRHGTCWVLGERDCSIQRRHQKVVEETPAPGISDRLRAALRDAARTAAEAVGYVGAGTVEFLVEGERFWFLEMNTRLQVEHPVTECVTGLDLVALQLAVAEGSALQGDPPSPQGHAIEVRLYAEDPADDYQPQTGRVRTFEVPGVAATFANPPSHGIRLDSGVETGDVVGVHYDAMLAKVIAWAPDRASAIRMLIGALRRTRLHGVRTNLDLLVSILGSPGFGSGDVHTALLGEHLGVWARPRADRDAIREAAAAAALGEAVSTARRSRVQSAVPPAFRNVTSQPRTRTYLRGGVEIGVDYAWYRDGLVLSECGDIKVVKVDTCSVTLERGGVVRTYGVTIHDHGVDVDGPSGSVSFDWVPRFVDPAGTVTAGSLLAPMPGTVLSVAVGSGDRVGKGQVVLVLEAMKMQHTIRAPKAGTIAQIAVSQGSQVESGAVLAVIDDEQGDSA